MSATLTRRSLFKAFRPGDDISEPDERVALIGAGCVEPKGVTCRRCGEACDLNAIRFRLQRGGAQTILDLSICNGCGDCVGVCPVGAIALTPRDRALAAASLAEGMRT